MANQNYKFQGCKMSDYGPQAEGKNVSVEVFLLLAYLAFEYMRFQSSVLPFLSPLRIPLLIFLALLFVVIKNRSRIPKQFIIACSSIFVAQMIVWVPFATNNFMAYRAALTMSMNLITMISLVLLIDTRPRLIILLRAWIYICTCASLWVISHGGRGPGGFVSDENDVCMLLVSAIPIAWYLFLQKDEPKKKRALYAMSFLLLLLGVVATSSRGGMLGAVAGLACIVWFSRRRWRNILLVLALAVAAGSVLLQVLPDKYVADMATISDKEDGTRNERLLLWDTAWVVFKYNPVFGVGPDNYPWVSSQYFSQSRYYDPKESNRSGRPSHSLYFTLIPESGLLGISLFFLVLFHIYKKLYANKDIVVEDKFIVFSICAGLLSVLVASAFISTLYYPLVWHLFAFSSAAILVLTPGGDGAHRLSS